jgi:hypothetical protein
MKMFALALFALVAQQAAAIGAPTDADRLDLDFEAMDRLDAEGKLDVIGRVIKFMDPSQSADPDVVLRKLGIRSEVRRLSETDTYAPTTVTYAPTSLTYSPTSETYAPSELSNSFVVGQMSFSGTTAQEILDNSLAYQQLVADIAGNGVVATDVSLQDLVGDTSSRRKLQTSTVGFTYIIELAAPVAGEVFKQLEGQSEDDIRTAFEELQKDPVYSSALAGVVFDASKVTSNSPAPPPSNAAPSPLPTTAKPVTESPTAKPTRRISFSAKTECLIDQLENPSDPCGTCCSQCNPYTAADKAKFFTSAYGVPTVLPGGACACLDLSGDTDFDFWGYLSLTDEADCFFSSTDVPLVTENDENERFAYFYAHGGDDVVVARGGPNAYESGDAGWEIYGQEGDDEVYIKEGIWSVSGAEGDDKIDVGKGWLMEGGQDDDQVYVRGSAMIVDGGGGADDLFVGGDVTALKGGDGIDTCRVKGTYVKSIGCETGNFPSPLPTQSPKPTVSPAPTSSCTLIPGCTGVLGIPCDPLTITDPNTCWKLEAGTAFQSYILVDAAAENVGLNIEGLLEWSFYLSMQVNGANAAISVSGSAGWLYTQPSASNSAYSVSGTVDTIYNYANSVSIDIKAGGNVRQIQVWAQTTTITLEAGSSITEAIYVGHTSVGTTCNGSPLAAPSSFAQNFIAYTAADCGPAP